MKNPRRVAAGKAAYERRKAAQDEADKPIMEIISAIVGVLFLIGMFITIAAKHH